jgi:hypothetical protein
MSYKIILNNSEEFIADNINESVENRDGNYLSALSLNFSKKLMVLHIIHYQNWKKSLQALVICHI